MQQEPKFSRFMFHLKFSNSEEYLNEHELYEVMRSRNLYQEQFGVRSNFRKIMRNIAIAEKAERYGFENSRKLFVQKMRERREQADKLRMLTSSFKPKNAGDKNGKRKIERRYVPIPQSTTIYSEFPAIVPTQKVISAIASIASVKSPERPASKMTPLPVPQTPSMMAATSCTDDLERRDEDFSPMKTLYEDHAGYTVPIKIIVAGRETPNTVTRTPFSRRATEELKLAKPISEFQKRFSMDIGNLDLLREKPTMLVNEEELKKQEDFIRKTKTGRGKLLESTVQMTDGLPEDSPKRSAKKYYDDTTEKCEIWREKHGLVSTEGVEKESGVLKRLMVDRPSKFTLSHVQDDGLLDAVDLRYKMMQKIAREMDESFQRKAQKQEQRLDKGQAKSESYITLPEIDTKPKPMVTMDPGGTTPDGRLILTQADYDDYLSGFKKARIFRLDKAKQHELSIEKRVKEFSLTPDLKLREPTRLENPVPLLRA